MRLVPALYLLAGLALSGPALAATPAAPCPVGDFATFLEQFSARITAQEHATADPVLLRRIDPSAMPEPAAYTQTIALADVLWPVMPNLDIARRHGKQVLVSGDGGQRQVTVRDPDNGNQVRYVFALQPCWTLQAVYEEAL